MTEVEAFFPELVAYILLFAEMDFPEYTVAVGRLRNVEYRVMAASISE
jgi:hypothetical protein